MSLNPHWYAWRLRRKNERRFHALPSGVPLGLHMGGFVGDALRIGAVVAAGFGTWQNWYPASVEEAGAAVTWGGLGLVMFFSIDLYGALIRSEDRAVLDILPVRGAEVVQTAVRRVAFDRGWLVAVVIACLCPLYRLSPTLFALSALAQLGIAALAVGVAAWVHLLAVDVAENPRWATILDAIRGRNPRPQAAFLYAPGVVLLGAGAVVHAVGAGVVAGRETVAWGGIASTTAFLLGFAGYRGALAVADRAWVRAGMVRAEIDARYAAIEDPEAARRVYFEWAIRVLPCRIRAYALRDLRHGWRVRRAFVTGPWFVGFAAAYFGWTVDRHAAVGVAVVGIWAFAAVGVLIEQAEPAWLRSCFNEDRAARIAARWVAGSAWVQGAAWPSVAAVALKFGAGPALRMAALLALHAVLAVAVAFACGQIRHRAMWAYGAVAVPLAWWAVGGAQ